MLQVAKQWAEMRLMGCERGDQDALGILDVRGHGLEQRSGRRSDSHAKPPRRQVARRLESP
jgi:hypothetical protein